MFLIRFSADFLWNFVKIIDSLFIKATLSLVLLLANAFRARELSYVGILKSFFGFAGCPYVFPLVKELSTPVDYSVSRVDPSVMLKYRLTSFFLNFSRISSSCCCWCDAYLYFANDYRDTAPAILPLLFSYLEGFATFYSLPFLPILELREIGSETWLGNKLVTFDSGSNVLPLVEVALDFEDSSEIQLSSDYVVNFFVS